MAEKKGYSMAEFRKLLQSWQSEPCKRGDYSHCPSADKAKAYLEKPDGSRQYFCWIGCPLLMLSDEDIGKVFREGRPC